MKHSCFCKGPLQWLCQIRLELRAIFCKCVAGSPSLCWAVGTVSWGKSLLLAFRTIVSLDSDFGKSWVNNPATSTEWSLWLLKLVFWSSQGLNCQIRFRFCHFHAQGVLWGCLRLQVNKRFDTTSLQHRQAFLFQLNSIHSRQTVKRPNRAFETHRFVVAHFFYGRWTPTRQGSSWTQHWMTMVCLVCNPTTVKLTGKKMGSPLKSSKVRLRPPHLISRWKSQLTTFSLSVLSWKVFQVRLPTTIYTHTDLSDLSEVEGPDECEMDCEEGRSNSTSPDPLLLFRFAFIIGSTLVSKFGLSHLLQNTWIGRAVAFSSYFSGIGGLEVALAYLNAAFKALASWICFHSLLCFGELVVWSFSNHWEAQGVFRWYPVAFSNHHSKPRICFKPPNALSCFFCALNCVFPTRRHFWFKIILCFFSSSQTLGFV